MQVVEKLFLAAFGLIALYILFNAQEAGNVIGALGQNVGGLFGTLQGANVQYNSANGGAGVTVNRPMANNGF